MKCRRSEHHGGDGRDSICLKKVCCHSGAVSDVISDVVSDDAGISWIIFGNAGFDFADEVSADVSGFGEDAAADQRGVGPGKGKNLCARAITRQNRPRYAPGRAQSLSPTSSFACWPRLSNRAPASPPAIP